MRTFKIFSADIHIPAGAGLRAAGLRARTHEGGCYLVLADFAQIDFSWNILFLVFWPFAFVASLSRDPRERSTKYHSAGPAGVHAVLAAAGGGRRHAGGRHTQPHLRGAAPGQSVNSSDDSPGF